jgi:hypothetical protein
MDGRRFALYGPGLRAAPAPFIPLHYYSLQDSAYSYKVWIALIKLLYAPLRHYLK